MTWHTGRMSAFLPLDNSGGDIDEYEVCGKISSIRKLKLDFVINLHIFVPLIACVNLMTFMNLGL